MILNISFLSASLNDPPNDSNDIYDNDSNVSNGSNDSHVSNDNNDSNDSNDSYTADMSKIHSTVEHTPATLNKNQM